MTKPVLVTGGAGFIGSHVCKSLRAAGYTPIAYDDLRRGHAWAVKWGPLEVGDVTDADATARVLRRYEPKAVIHLAAYAYIGESVTKPGEYYRNNVLGSLNLIQSMVEHGVRDIVFSSSCSTYGLPASGLISEAQGQSPLSPYAWSKLMVERMLADFGAAHGLRHCSLRYFNAAGGDPDGDVGEAHDPETHLIPIALDVALGQRAELVINGADYETPDGTCVRDYVHVADIASAHVLAMEGLANPDRASAYNLGVGKGHSVLEVAAAVEAVTGSPVPLRRSSRRPGDAPALVADSSLARSQLGWVPRYADLTTMVEHAWRWRLGPRQ